MYDVASLSILPMMTYAVHKIALDKDTKPTTFSFISPAQQLPNSPCLPPVPGPQQQSRVNVGTISGFKGSISRLIYSIMLAMTNKYSKC